VSVHAFGAPVLRARMRATPEDFRVDELDGFEASGAGEHLLLTIRKRGMNTAFAAKRLAQWAGIAEMGVSYAGLKDRHAVTTQRFSVHLPKKIAPDLAALESDDMQVLHSTWHSRKLPRGALAGNRFVLTLRDVQGEHAAIEDRLRVVQTRGVPNFFGEQRFGREGDNVAQALQMFAGRRVKREQRTLLLSAARSALFNRVLERRVDDERWDRAIDGDVWMLEGSRSVFGPEPFDDALAARLASFDIHPSGPLWGEGDLRTTGEARALEEAALDDAESRAVRAGLEAARLKQERRALRLRPQAMAWEWPAHDVLQLTFELPPGSYATTVIGQIGEIG
jgi:tRNA pseudouridine13 synthase